MNMGELLALHSNKRVYLFTTQGHVISGILENGDELVTLLAPDGVTRVQVNLTDVSGVRLYTEEPEDAS